MNNSSWKNHKVVFTNVKIKLPWSVFVTSGKTEYQTTKANKARRSASFERRPSRRYSRRTMQNRGEVTEEWEQSPREYTTTITLLKFKMFRFTSAWIVYTHSITQTFTWHEILHIHVFIIQLNYLLLFSFSGSFSRTIQSSRVSTLKLVKQPFLILPFL